MSEARLIGVQNNEQRLKWDARGALFGHPGPSPPFGKFFVYDLAIVEKNIGVRWRWAFDHCNFLYRDYYTVEGVCPYNLISYTESRDIKVHQRVANKVKT